MSKNTSRYSFEITKELKQKLDNLKRYSNKSEYIRNAIEDKLSSEPIELPPLTIPFYDNGKIEEVTIFNPMTRFHIDNNTPVFEITAQPTNDSARLWSISGGSFK